MGLWGVVGSVLAGPSQICHFWQFSLSRVAIKYEKQPWKPVFELSDQVFGPGIGLWGVVESVLARPSQIYHFWSFSQLRVAGKWEKWPWKPVFELKFKPEIRIDDRPFSRPSFIWTQKWCTKFGSNIARLSLYSPGVVSSTTLWFKRSWEQNTAR